jgi:hypothetical protein
MGQIRWDITNEKCKRAFEKEGTVTGAAALLGCTAQVVRKALDGERVDPNDLEKRFKGKKLCECCGYYPVAKGFRKLCKYCYKNGEADIPDHKLLL